MPARTITERVQWVGAVDWNRRLFDDLVPLPEGTSYNAYLVRGSEQTALIDTVDPALQHNLLEALESLPRLDYLVCQHVEQDHSGTIPQVLARFPEATLLCSTKARPMGEEHLHVEPSRIRTVADGETVSLGDRTLQFIYAPWVHWPETMLTLLPEERILFTCDFLGSHFATSRLLAGNDPAVINAAARYYAEIMMPFAPAIRNNLKKLDGIEFDIIAPSHGPLHDQPSLIIEAYRDWISDRVANRVVIPYISMHGSTEAMVDHLICALAERGIASEKFNLTVTDLGRLAVSLLDAATLVIGSSTVLMGAHPSVIHATAVANVLRPKVRHAAIIGSYGWATKMTEQLTAMIPNLKVELLGTVLCKGLPQADDLAALDALADTIRDRHTALGLL
ncbi:MAG: FprA family A-type flavoprotein [Kiritimatiellia bacterium]|jgi:flavorubredoxin